MARKILMIDKKVDEARKLKVNLENFGYEVFICKTLSEGNVIINSYNVDLAVVIDTEYESETFWSSITAQNIPVLAVFESSLKESGNKLLMYLDDYAFRPYDEDQLYLKIKNNIKIKILQDQIKRKDAEIDSLKQQLKEVSLIDKVTGLYNVLFLRHILSSECSSSSRYGYKLSGMALLLEGIKEEDERYNEVLGEMVRLIKRNIRFNDVFVRLDSGEFYLLLPHTGLKDAMFVADKLRKQVESHKFPFIEGITISAGVTSLDEIDKGLRKEDEMVSQAKEALEIAVSKGGNTIECF